MEDLLSCLEEYFQAGGSEGFTDKLVAIDQKQEATTADSDDPLLSWSSQTFSLVLCYVKQFCTNSEKHMLIDTIDSLCCIAGSYLKRKFILSGYQCYVDEINKKGREFTDVLESSFISQVSRFFEVPKPQENTDNNLKQNEILAAFMNFLVQMLFCLENSNSAEKQQYALLGKELSFLISVLGDAQFQLIHPGLEEQTDNLLVEFEMLASVAGWFLYSCVFPIHPIKVSRFYSETTVLIEKTRLLNAKIEEHCNKFSELPIPISRCRMVDSFFIVNSLIEDLQSILKNGQHGSLIHDDTIIDQIKGLQDELIYSQIFVEVFQVARDTSTKELKETLIQIRDLAYEVEYLINSNIVGNVPIWYLNLRLTSIVQKIKLVNKSLPHIKEMDDAKDTKPSDAEVSIRRTMENQDDNQIVDFNDAITKKILKDLIGKPKSA